MCEKFVCLLRNVAWPHDVLYPWPLFVMKVELGSVLRAPGQFLGIINRMMMSMHLAGINQEQA